MIIEIDGLQKSISDYRQQMNELESVRDRIVQSEEELVNARNIEQDLTNQLAEKDYSLYVMNTRMTGLEKELSDVLQEKETMRVDIVGKQNIIQQYHVASR